MDPSDEDAVNVETNALNLRWSFGFNTSVAGAVHSLATANRNAVFYVSSHTGVIHDTDRDMQYLLQGHCNPITAVCVSKDKRWIATADSGEDAMIVVWDSIKATSVKIIPLPYQEGITAMDLSADSMFLVTLSAGEQQQIAIWEWTVATLDPAITAEVGDHEYLHCVRFNQVDVRDIVSNGNTEVIFWNWTEQALTAFHPPKGVKKLKKNVGDLTQSVFIPYTTKVVTATESGNVVLWDYPVSELVQSTGRDAIKVLRLVNKAGVNVLDTILDRYVVCGCTDGAVRFFDFQFRVVAWFEDINAGQIMSVSFAEGVSTSNATATTGNNVTMDEFQVPDFVVGTTEGKIIRLESRLVDHMAEEKRRGTLLVQGFNGDVNALDTHPYLPLFAVGTSEGFLHVWDLNDRVISASRNFEVHTEIKENHGRGKGKRGGKDGAGDDVNGVTGGGDSSHASKTEKHSVEDGGHPDKSHHTHIISCLKFGPRGKVLAVGFANGLLKLLSAEETADYQEKDDTPLTNLAPPLRDVRAFKNSQQSITHICFSPDGKYLATADEDRCVGLYRYYHRFEETDKPLEWIFVGKFRSHYKPITNISFVPAPSISSSPSDPSIDSSPDSAPCLFSLGEDRILHEYDIGASSIRAGLKLKNSTNVDQVAVPTSFVCIPGDKSDNAEEATPDLLITSNDDYKLKVWDLSSNLPDVTYNVDHNNSYEGGGNDDVHGHSMRQNNIKVCRKTLLAPTYGGPLNKMFMLPKREGKDIVPSQFMVYGTHSKVVGLVKLPLDGNPNKSMALIAHPGEISCLVSSFDGKYLITAGGKDRSVNLWAVSTTAVEASIALGGTGIEPYMGLLEGGANGSFYQDLLDYFYYAQLCSQGVKTTAPRQVTGFIPVEQVVDLMRALGYYPTQQDVIDICNEIKFDHHSQISSFKDKVDLEEFIKLYVNYRPVFGLGKKQFRAAFRSLKKAHTLLLRNYEEGEEGDKGVEEDEGEEADAEPDEELTMERDALLDMLLNMGEAMSLDEIAGAIKTLVGRELPADQDSESVLAMSMPESYTPDTFAQEVLGFQDYENE